MPSQHAVAHLRDMEALYGLEHLLKGERLGEHSIRSAAHEVVHVCLHYVSGDADDQSLIPSLAHLGSCVGSLHDYVKK